MRMETLWRRMVLVAPWRTARAGQDWSPWRTRPIYTMVRLLLLQREHRVATRTRLVRRILEHLVWILDMDMEPHGCPSRP